MRQYSISCIFLLVSSALFAQNEQDVIRNAKKQASAGKYESAFNLLWTFDPGNTKPSIVLLKEELALNFYSNTIMHRMFSFKDLGKNETIEGIRDQKNKGEMHELPVNDILDSMIRKNPKDYRLYKGLGEYYFTVYKTYGNNWLVPEKELLKRIEKNDSIAMSRLSPDYLTYYQLGYAYLMDEKYGEALENLTKSVNLNPKYLTGQYSLSYTYEYVHNADSALKYAQNVLKLSKDSIEKADAARMIGYIHAEQKDFEKANKYVDWSNRIDPNNYDTYRARLEIELSENSSDIETVTREFYIAKKDKPNIYNDLLDVYSDHGKQKQLIEFFKSRIPSVGGNQAELASLYFYIGTLYILTDKIEAKTNLLKAKDIFSRIYPADNEVFKVIENNLKKTK